MEFHQILCTREILVIKNKMAREANTIGVISLCNYTPRKLCLWEGILFSRCPSERTNESVSVTFCFLNILKSH